MFNIEPGIISISSEVFKFQRTMVNIWTWLAVIWKLTIFIGSYEPELKLKLIVWDEIQCSLLTIHDGTI